MAGREFGTRAGVDWDAVAAAGDFERYSTRQLADDWGVHHASVARAAKPRRCVACEECFPLVDAECPRCGHLRGRPAPVGEARPIRDIPDGHLVKGVSTMLGPEGEVKAQWIKTREDPDHREARIQAVIDAAPALLEHLKGGIAPRLFAGPVLEDMLAAYVWGDPHFGQHSDEEETGDAWDLDIAVEAHLGAMASLVAGAPAAGTAVLCLMGDNTHNDNDKNRTPTSGHPLDVHHRHFRIARALDLAVRHAIDMLLDRHEHVRVYILPGNHDITTAPIFAIAVRNAYLDEPRVTVDMQPGVMKWLPWGNELLVMHHGHTLKVPRLPGVIAADPRIRPLWGAAKHTHVYCGHVHHKTFQEFDGCTVETVNTLTGRDAHAASHGYSPRRSLKVDLWDKRDGLVTTNVCGIARAMRAA